MIEKQETMKSLLVWRKGSVHPEKSGIYLAVKAYGGRWGISAIYFTLEYGWNSTSDESEDGSLAVSDDDILCWTDFKRISVEKALVNNFGGAPIYEGAGKTVAQDYTEDAINAGRWEA